MDDLLVREFRKARAWQRECANNGGGSLTVFPSGRTELSFGGGWYGEHAISAFLAAKRTIHFRKAWSEDLLKSRKRSRAARKGWAARRAGGAA